MSYPATLDIFPNPQASDQRPGHAQLHRDINAVVIALQAKLGIDGSLDNTSIDFLVKSALNPGHTHSKDKVGLGNVANALQLIASNNLSDLIDVTTAVANLGLTFAKTLSYASQAEAEAGIDNTKIMTPLRVKQEMAIFATPIASDVEFLAGTIETKAVNPKQIKDNYGYSIVPSDVAVSSGGYKDTFSQTLFKVTSVPIMFSGTYRVKFTLRASWGSYQGAVKGQIYKNGVAYGTFRSFSSYEQTTEFTEDLAFTAGDTCEIWFASATSYGYLQYFLRMKLCFSLVPTKFIQAVTTY